MYVRAALPKAGLGFPIGPVIGIGASAIAGLFGGGGSKNEKWNRGDAEVYVRQQYLQIFRREPDPGAEGYVRCLVEGECNAEDVVKNLYNSGEYADKKARGLLTRPLPVTAAAPTSFAPSSPSMPGSQTAPLSTGGYDPLGASAPIGGGVSSMLSDYGPYLLGGGVLLMLLRK